MAAKFRLSCTSVWDGPLRPGSGFLRRVRRPSHLIARCVLAMLLWVLGPIASFGGKPRPVALLASHEGTIVEVADDGSITRQVDLTAAVRWPGNRIDEERVGSRSRPVTIWVAGSLLTEGGDRLVLLVTGEEMTGDDLVQGARWNWLVTVGYADLSVEDVVELSKDRLHLFGMDRSNRIVLAALAWADGAPIDSRPPELSLWHAAPLRLESQVELSPEDAATLSRWGAIDRRLEVRSEGIFKGTRTGGILLPPGHRLGVPVLSASAAARVRSTIDPSFKVESWSWPPVLDRQARAGVRLAAFPLKLFEMKERSPILTFAYREEDGELVDEPRTWNPSRVYLIPDGSGFFVLESEPTNGKIPLHRVLFGMGRYSLVELDPGMLGTNSGDWDSDEPCAASDGAWSIFRGANFESVFIRWQDGFVARVPFRAWPHLCARLPLDRR